MQLFIILAVVVLASSKSIEENQRYKVVATSLVVPENPDEFLLRVKVNVTRGGRVSNGVLAYNGQFPWVAELLTFATTGTVGSCTGALISNNFVVSARHCLLINNQVPLTVGLMMGAADLNSASKVAVYSDAYYVLNAADGNHPDVALFKLNNKVATTSTVRPIRLPSGSQESWTFENWSILLQGYAGTTCLKYGSFKVVPNYQCNFNDNLICSVGEASSAVLSESGDSGGPITAYEGGVPTLFGIHLGKNYVGQNTYMRALKISKYLSFFRDITGIPIR